MELTKHGKRKQARVTGRLNIAAQQVVQLALEYSRVNGRYEVNAGNSTHFDGAKDFLKFEGFRYDAARKVWHTTNERIIARLWPQQSRIKLSRTPANIYKFAAPARPNYAAICKELADMPLARGPRCTAQWVSDGQGGAKAVLPGEEKVELRLTAGPRRCPHAFDISLMMTLLALARMHGTSAFIFSGYRQLLRMLGYDAARNSGADNRKVSTLKEALDYLSRLSITLEHSGAITQLPPLVTKVGKEGNLLKVEIDHDFFAFASNNHKPPAWLPLPLPDEFVTQNLLMLTTASSWKLTEDVNDAGKQLRQRKGTRLSVLARKTGLRHSTRNRDLRSAFRKVEAVYARHGGLIEIVDLQGGEAGMLLRRHRKLKPPRDRSLGDLPIDREGLDTASHSGSEGKTITIRPNRDWTEVPADRGCRRCHPQRQRCRQPHRRHAHAPTEVS